MGKEKANKYISESCSKIRLSENPVKQEASSRSGGSSGVLRWLQHCLAHYWHRGRDGLCASKNVTTSLHIQDKS